MDQWWARRRRRLPMMIRYSVWPGDHSGGVPPVPIPNTEVKPSSADGTVRFRAGE